MLNKKECQDVRPDPSLPVKKTSRTVDDSDLTGFTYTFESTGHDTHPSDLVHPGWTRNEREGCTGKSIYGTRNIVSYHSNSSDLKNLLRRKFLRLWRLV